MDRNCIFCPWVQDAENPNRYVCLKCGKERNIDLLKIPAPIVVILAVIFLSIIQSNLAEKSPPLKTPSSPPSITK
jgi:hypothetical protein